MIVKGNITIVYPEKVYAAGAANVNMPESPAFAARRIAEELAKKVEKYRIPEAVKKKTNINSLLEISEKWLIVCCVPEAKDDDRIATVIDEYINEGLREHIIPVLVSGSPDESFPYALLHIRNEDGTVTDIEPLAANLTAPTMKERLGKLKVEALRIFAPILGVSFDELNRRDLKRKKRILVIVGTAVIAIATGFFIYSLHKVKTISDQSKQINELYSEIKQAEEDMENQKNEAIYQNQLLLSRKAKKALDEYDVQLAIEYCLAGFDKDNPENSIEELKDVFDDSLEIACAVGYVPVTSWQEYNRQNNTKRPALYDPVYPDSGYEEKYREVLPEDMRKIIEEKNETDLSGKVLMADFELEDYSEKFGYAIYDASYKDTDLKWNYYCEKIHFKDHPEDDYYLKNEDGEYISISYVTAWEDGTFTGDTADGYVRFSALTGECLGRLGRYYYDGDSCYHTDDRKFFICIRDWVDTFDVYNSETGELLYSVTGSWVSSNHDAVFMLDDGRDYLVFRSGKVYVYDIASGKELIFETDDPYTNAAEISKEGMLLVSGDYIGKIYDIKSGELVAEIPNTNINYGSMQFYGEPGMYNLTFGSERIDSGNIIFEYHENSTPVPETLEDKIKIAERLISKGTSEE